MQTVHLLLSLIFVISLIPAPASAEENDVDVIDGLKTIVYSDVLAKELELKIDMNDIVHEDMVMKQPDRTAR